MIRGGAVTLQVRDVAEAVRFYVETLGMKLTEDGGSAWATIDAGEGFSIRLHAGASRAPTPGGPAVWLNPKLPLDDVIAVLGNRGVTFAVEQDGGLRLARFEDPDGNTLYLYQAT